MESLCKYRKIFAVFTCAIIISIPIGDQPILISPADGATQGLNELMLSWSSLPTATTYGVQVSTLSSFATTIVNQTGLTNTWVSLTFDFSTLYYWHANASNSAATSAWSLARMFTTGIYSNGKPYLNSPSKGQSNVVISGYLVWHSVSQTGHYNVQLAYDSLFSNLVRGYGGSYVMGSDNYLQYNGLKYATKYYWQVEFVGSDGSMSWSSVWSFTTVKQTATIPQVKHKPVLKKGKLITADLRGRIIQIEIRQVPGVYVMPSNKIPLGLK